MQTFASFYARLQSGRVSERKNKQMKIRPSLQEKRRNDVLWKQNDLVPSHLSGDDGYFWYCSFCEGKQQFGSMSDDAAVLLSRTCSQNKDPLP